MQGSGWGALTWEPLGQRLIVEQIYDHQSNVGQGAPPLLVLDMWEHAYYLQYQQREGRLGRGVLGDRQLARRRRALRARARKLRLRLGAASRRSRR